MHSVMGSSFSMPKMMAAVMASPVPVLSAISE